MENSSVRYEHLSIPALNSKQNPVFRKTGLYSAEHIILVHKTSSSQIIFKAVKIIDCIVMIKIFFFKFPDWIIEWIKFQHYASEKISVADPDQHGSETFAGSGSGIIAPDPYPAKNERADI